MSSQDKQSLSPCRLDWKEAISKEYKRLMDKYSKIYKKDRRVRVKTGHKAIVNWIY